MWLFNFCMRVIAWQYRLEGRKHQKPSPVCSKGERAIKSVLVKHGIEHEAQYAISPYMHADFAVHVNGRLMLIEYDGRQHYHPVKRFGGWNAFMVQRIRDTLERMECHHRKVPLLRIKYNLPMEKIEPVVMGFIRKNRN